MSIENRIEEVKRRFGQFNDWEQRYAEIIKVGRTLAPLPEEGRQEKFLVKGCQSQVWLYPKLENSRVIYYADSDAAIAKGIIALLVQVYSGATPDEIINNKEDFLKEIGITEHLSMNRTNGLKAMAKQVKLYALAMKAIQ